MIFDLGADRFVDGRMRSRYSVRRDLRPGSPRWLARGGRVDGERANARFGHSPADLDFWRSHVRPLLDSHPTPFYLFSIMPIQDALGELETCFGHLPVRHWLSCK